MKIRLLLNDLMLIALGLGAAFVAGVYVLGFNPKLVIFMIVLIVLFYLPYLVRLVRTRLRPSSDAETQDQGDDKKKTMQVDFLLAGGGIIVALLMSVFFVGFDAVTTSIVLFLVAVRYTPHLVKSYRESQGVGQR